jgi:SSS family solute:Na+ symporter
MHRMGLVFLIALAITIGVSLARPASGQANRIVTGEVSYRTSTAFNVAAIGVLAILCVLYFVWW